MWDYWLEKNDISLLEETKEGRNINRHYYTEEEIAEEVKRPSGREADKADGIQEFLPRF